MRASPALLVSFAAMSAAQSAGLQSVGFNSSVKLTPSQIALGQLTDDVVQSIENVLDFDNSQLAHGGPSVDDFYTLPPLSNTTGPLKAGQLLKVQEFTDPSSYNLPPEVALSRILYTTADLNGTVLPTSAYILWPYQPHHFEGIEHGNTTKAPVVLWNHGTSGYFDTQAPSAHRALWYANAAPYTLAQAGYAVVAPDYAGLGISRTWDGSEFGHQYLASPASANDALYALRAAHEAFSNSLADEYVVMGHSQGGGVAWSVAEHLANREEEFADLLDGYRGTIAGSPTTDLFTGDERFIVTSIALIIGNLFPGFDPSIWLTDLGIARTQLLKELKGSLGVALQLFFTDEPAVNPGYINTPEAQAYAKLGNAGNKDFKGPLLVIQGVADVYVSFNVTQKTVKDTQALYPDHDLEMWVLPSVGHVPVLDASRQKWLKWIEERFEGKPLAKTGSVTTTVKSWLPSERYNHAGFSFLQWAGAPEFNYQAILGL